MFMYCLSLGTHTVLGLWTARSTHSVLLWWKAIGVHVLRGRINEAARVWESQIKHSNYEI